MLKRIVLLTLVLALAASAPAMAAKKTYQVTGPVLEKTADMIAVQKGTDRWEIALDAGSGVPAGLQVGDKVTIEYRMTATSVTAKAAKGMKKKSK